MLYDQSLLAVILQDQIPQMVGEQFNCSSLSTSRWCRWTLTCRTFFSPGIYILFKIIRRWCLWVKGPDINTTKPICDPTLHLFPSLSYRYPMTVSINNTHSLISHRWRVKLMHHKADSFHSQNLFLKSAAYAYGCWWVYSMMRKNTRCLNKRT